ncbi:type I methionyl aminopeptidase [Deinococcus peraridilitoris]|uniref:Methionine aminopeptidase n=1 Tax=Deinococcus peraridilitoris (strain DSM 19664 / LMG 22246 / CIP 109416 / KR-200) TaxID=937777 RepID=L0A4I5_DEIPD|nr:type I methionyl aminopeptidase [Deinococcus peraridilitoris]AFZ68798.1 methionine aminopeptidase, type I [Deinococcus peraridilitoris DSM 19664]
MARIVLKNPREIEALRQANHLVAQTFEVLEPHVKPGASLGELDRIAEDFIRAQGAIPAYKGYAPNGVPFPATICASVNEVICHGIPSQRRLREGDIIGVDIGVKLNGFFGDACYTYVVGGVNPQVRKLVDTTRECLAAGLAVIKPGARTGDIGHAIQTLAESRGFSVVREYTGHGIGQRLHEEPTIYHWGKPGSGLRLVEGMVFTVEPMINLGRPETRLLGDDWTVVTADGKPSAQFEHTIAVTAQGVDILSL